MAEADDLAAYGPWLLTPEDRSPLQPPPRQPRPPPLVTARDCRYCWPTFVPHSKALHKHVLKLAKRKLEKRAARVSGAGGAVPAGGASR